MADYRSGLRIYMKSERLIHDRDPSKPSKTSVIMPVAMSEGQGLKTKGTLGALKWDHVYVKEGND